MRTVASCARHRSERFAERRTVGVCSFISVLAEFLPDRHTFELDHRNSKRGLRFPIIHHTSYFNTTVIYKESAHNIIQHSLPEPATCTAELLPSASGSVSLLYALYLKSSTRSFCKHKSKSTSQPSKSTTS